MMSNVESGTVTVDAATWAIITERRILQRNFLHAYFKLAWLAEVKA